MKLSIIGLPVSGVTAVFNALTGRHPEGHPPARPGHAAVAVVKVPDPRLDFLARLHPGKRVVHAAVEYFEVPGFFTAGAGGASSDSAAAAVVRDSDACVKVLRSFDSETAPNPRGKNDPARDLRDVNDELLTLDLGSVEKRVTKLRKDMTKPVPEAEQKQNRTELGALERCHAALERGEPLDRVVLNEQEARLLRGFCFFTAKPCVHVVNVNESDIGNPGALANLPPANSVAFCAKIEDEIHQLDEADRAEFLTALGIKELACDALIRTSYEVLGLIAFLTVGADEVRAWALKAGATAFDAAAAVHSDMARGFIRAEVVRFGDLERLGSEREVKAKGLMRLEGHDYVVQDGDIIFIRFHV